MLNKNENYSRPCCTFGATICRIKSFSIGNVCARQPNSTRIVSILCLNEMNGMLARIMASDMHFINTNCTFLQTLAAIILRSRTNQYKRFVHFYFYFSAFRFSFSFFFFLICYLIWATDDAAE